LGPCLMNSQQSSKVIDGMLCQLLCLFSTFLNDKKTHPPYGNEGCMQRLLGDRPDPEALQMNCCEDRVAEYTPPTFLWYTADGEAVHVQNSLLYANALSQANVPFDLHVYQSGPHGMALAPHDEHVANWKSACRHWLRRNRFD